MSDEHWQKGGGGEKKDEVGKKRNEKWKYFET